MKELLVIGCAFLVLQCGTDQRESIEYNYSIQNSSGKPVKMIPYVNGIKDIQNAINLAPGESLNKKYTYKAPGAAGYTMTEFFVSHTDYVEFVYNNEKINIFSTYSQQCTTCPTINSSFPVIYNENPRNIFNVKYRDDQIETYTITPEDYQNATPCNGNCY